MLGTPVIRALLTAGRQWGGAALDLLFPPRCQVCLELDREPLCGRCRSQIIFLAPPLCDVCGQPLPDLPHAGDRCAVCRQNRYAFDRCRSVASFAGVMRDAIHALKYHGRLPLAPPLAELMVERVGETRLMPGLSGVDLVVAVPLHRQRHRQRGYNQSELLAGEIARRLDRPLDLRALVRARSTADQIGLTARQRRENVRGAFAVARPQAVREKSVLIIDDTLTTGATLDECARSLRRAGARQVLAFTLARQLAPGSDPAGSPPSARRTACP